MKSWKPVASRVWRASKAHRRFLKEKPKPNFSCWATAIGTRVFASRRFICLFPPTTTSLPSMKRHAGGPWTICDSGWEKRRCSGPPLASSIQRPIGRNADVEGLETYFRQIGKSLDTLLREAEGLDFTIALENMLPSEGGRFTSRPEHFERIIRDFVHPNLGFCLDTGHALVAGRGNAHRFFEVMGPRIVAFHLADNAGDRDSHLAPRPRQSGLACILPACRSHRLRTYHVHRNPALRLRSRLYRQRVGRDGGRYGRVGRIRAAAIVGPRGSYPIRFANPDAALTQRTVRHAMAGEIWRMGRGHRRLIRAGGRIREADRGHGSERGARCPAGRNEWTRWPTASDELTASRRRVVSVDLTDHNACRRIEERTGDLEVGLLVNNAGFGLSGAYTDLVPGRVLNMTVLNCVVPVQLTNHYLPRMLERGRGGLIFLASTAGVPGDPVSRCLRRHESLQSSDGRIPLEGIQEGRHRRAVPLARFHKNRIHPRPPA